MAELDNEGAVTLRELMVSALATADAVAKLLIEKQLVTADEFRKKLSEERNTYQRLLKDPEGPSRT